MQELEKRIGLLRILLADIQGKQTQLSEMETQFRDQLSRVVEYVVYREGDVGNALSIMSEIQNKLDEVQHSAQHLNMIADKALTELEVLLLTKRVAEARSQLASLKERQQELAAKLSQLSEGEEEPSDLAREDMAQMEDIRAIYDEVESEIARLHNLITDVSERAAKTVQSKARERI